MLNDKYYIIYIINDNLYYHFQMNLPLNLVYSLLNFTKIV